MKQEYNLKLSIKAICYFEQLTNTPFSKYMQKPDNILPLIYSVLVAHPENNFNLPYEQAIVFLSNDKILDPVATGIKQELDFINQFSRHRDSMLDTAVPDSSSTNVEPSSNDDSAVFMCDIIPVLVGDCGLDINYVMNEMNYTDIDSFIHYREQKHQSELEEKRLFTYLIMAPHVDSKKIKKPEDILPFPWEKEFKQKKFNSEVKDISEKLKNLGIIKGSS